jgi:hypothetical protein
MSTWSHIGIVGTTAERKPRVARLLPQQPRSTLWILRPADRRLSHASIRECTLAAKALTLRTPGPETGSLASRVEEAAIAQEMKRRDSITE